MPVCCVQSCSWSSTRKSKEDPEKKSFFAFPKADLDRRRYWIQIVGRETGWTPSRWSLVCDSHFKAELMTYGPGGRLHLDHRAVPELNLPDGQAEDISESLPSRRQRLLSTGETEDFNDGESVVTIMDSNAEHLNGAESARGKKNLAGDITEPVSTAEKRSSGEEQVAPGADRAATEKNNLESHEARNDPMEVSAEDETEATVNTAGSLPVIKDVFHQSNGDDIPDGASLSDNREKPKSLPQIKEVFYLPSYADLDNIFDNGDDDQGNDLDEVASFLCPDYVEDCKFKGATAEHLEAHKKYKHLNPLYCLSCSFQTPFKSRLKDHIKTIHIGSEKSQRDHCHSCSYCGRSGYSVKTLKNHLHFCAKTNAVVNSHPRKCHMCQFEAPNILEMKTHLNEHIKLKQPEISLMADSLSEAKQGQTKATHSRATAQNLGHQKVFTYTIPDAEEPKKARGKRMKRLNRHSFACTETMDCAFEGRDLGQLAQHLKNAHTRGKDHYICQLCPFSSLSTAKIVSHVNAIHKGCRYCNFVTDAETSLSSHLRHVHQDYVSQSEVIRKFAARHGQVVDFEQPVKTTAEPVFVSADATVLTVKQKTTTTLERDSRVFHGCMNCRFKARNLEEMLDHMDHYHTDGVKAPPVDPVTFSRQREKRQRIEAMDGAASDEDVTPKNKKIPPKIKKAAAKAIFPPKYKCRDFYHGCMFETVSFEEHRRHEAQHKSNDEHKCGQCEFQANFKTDLKDHVESVHKDNQDKAKSVVKLRFKCASCQDHFDGPDGLVCHMHEVHRRFIRFMGFQLCQTCNAGPFQAKELEMHLNSNACHKKEQTDGNDQGDSDVEMLDEESDDRRDPSEGKEDLVREEGVDLESEDVDKVDGDGNNSDEDYDVEKDKELSAHD